MNDNRNAPVSIPPVASGNEIFEPGSVYPQQMTDPEPQTKPPGSKDARQQAKNKNKGNTDTELYRK
ncbi:hypothetical protein J2785_001323 [Burkholderia ambifaria]|nr:hypothetical protein [Burkholderia ambifaria]MDR6498179.1 hypothetical protein [Burkholderia ambifaria]